MYPEARKLKSILTLRTRIVIIQADNPDGDSLGSALALEHILGDLGKRATAVLCRGYAELFTLHVRLGPCSERFAEPIRPQHHCGRLDDDLIGAPQRFGARLTGWPPSHAWCLITTKSLNILSTSPRLTINDAEPSLSW